MRPPPAHAPPLFYPGDGQHGCNWTNADGSRRGWPSYDDWAREFNQPREPVYADRRSAAQAQYPPTVYAEPRGAAQAQYPPTVYADRRGAGAEVG